MKREVNTSNHGEARKKNHKHNPLPITVHNYQTLMDNIQ